VTSFAQAFSESALSRDLRLALMGALLAVLTLAPSALAAAPRIDGTAATIGASEATLRGSINPGGEATSYEFEWGPTAAYGNSTASGNLPSGEEPVAVAAVLGGLSPGTTYHYRLVAENLADTTEGPDRTFTTPAGIPGFGAARAFELVSQYPTGGIPIYPNNALVSVSEDGGRVHLGTAQQPLPGSELIPPPDQLHNGSSYWRYGFVRGPEGWQMEEYGLAQSLEGAGISADGTTYFFSTISGWSDDSRLDPDDQNGGLVNNTDQDAYLRRPDGTLVWISRDLRIPVGTPQTALGNATLSGNFGMAQMSADGSTAVFESHRSLADADTTTGEPPANRGRLYKWRDGQLSFIGLRPDGSVPSAGTTLGTGNFALQATVSRDGTRVLFSAPRTESGEGGTIYIQTDGAPTVEAVKETGVPALPAEEPFAPRYRGASADLSRAFFTSGSRLTPDSGAGASGGGYEDLYVYDLGADEVRDLTPRLDGITDPGIDPAEADSGRARGIAANSEDGKRVYFVADAQYPVAPSPTGEMPSPEGRNLYLAELDGIDDPIELRFIAALGESDGQVWQMALTADNGKSSYASPDGSVLGFGSRQPLTGQPLGGTSQLFVYDAGADTLRCASCPPDGSLPVGDVNLREPLLGGQAWQYPNSTRRWISTDGRLFFHTAAQLLGGDTNFVDDVYEYRAGQLRLVSAGTGNNASRLEDVSRDGTTVVFNTGDALIPQDEEPGIPKLYAARVGGGFPVKPKPAPCDINAGACEGPGSQSPNLPDSGTAVFQGPGDPKPKKAGKRCRKGKHKVRRGGKVRCVARKHHHHKRGATSNRRASR
jgi:hypothetical protein